MRVFVNYHYNQGMCEEKETVEVPTSLDDFSQKDLFEGLIAHASYTDRQIAYLAHHQTDCAAMEREQWNRQKEQLKQLEGLLIGLRSWCLTLCLLGLCLFVIYLAQTALLVRSSMVLYQRVDYIEGNLMRQQAPVGETK